MYYQSRTETIKAGGYWDAISAPQPKGQFSNAVDYLSELGGRVAEWALYFFTWLADCIYATGITHAWSNLKVTVVDSLLKRVYKAFPSEKQTDVAGGSFLTNESVNKNYQTQLEICNGTISQAGLAASQTKVEIDSEISLDGIMIKSSRKLSASAKWILYFLPYHSYWEFSADDLIQLHKNSKANILCYNYRGLGRSSGMRSTCEQSDIDDGCEIVTQILHNSSIKIAQLALYGKVYGSHVALSVARQLTLTNNMAIPVIAERAHSSIKTLYREKSPIFSRIAAPLLSLLGWKLDTQKSLCNLRSHVLHIRLKNDPLIPHEASLHKPYDGDEFTGKFIEKSGDTIASGQKKVTEMFPYTI